MDRWEGIGRGTYWSDVVGRASARFTPGDQHEFLNALDHLLEAKVRPAAVSE